jgi:hypothetical protein
MRNAIPSEKTDQGLFVIIFIAFFFECANFSRNQQRQRKV